jgi:metal-sulfur cluster biosynthetic enzyme
MEKLSEVIDPEIGISIVEMGLIDEVKIENGNIEVVFHLTAPFRPPVFALTIARDIKQKIKSMEGVQNVKVTLRNHMMADMINKYVEEM